MKEKGKRGGRREGMRKRERRGKWESMKEKGERERERG